MNPTAPAQPAKAPRLLVAIASFGEKNLRYLKSIITSYQGLPWPVDIVVFSEAPKNLDPAVRVIVGLPNRNPWSLPFAHKAFFAQQLQQYDLFVYTEDDMEIAEQHIQAFLEATPALDPDEIAGYLRYEIDQSGSKIFTDIHGPFHWKVDSVRRRGAYLIAEHTNEHAGFYILTQSQLSRAIASGGFLRDPYEGRYGLPETAATDPYTSCGFRKIICISAIDDFLIHHMSNLYVARHGLTFDTFKDQIRTLTEIRDHAHPATSLCEVESKLRHKAWSKSYYEKPQEQLLPLVPDGTHTVLSIGCGSGATEARLQQRGLKITAFPLDSVVGAAAARSGLEVVYGTLEQCFKQIDGRTFDCVLITNLLHLFPSPEQIIAQSCQFVGPAGVLLIGGPCLHSLPVFLKRVIDRDGFRKLRAFDQSGIAMISVGEVKRRIRIADLKVVVLRYFDDPSPRKTTGLRRLLKRLGPDNWIIQARRPAP
jgi:SAM-dependent methyltransferase